MTCSPPEREVPVEERAGLTRTFVEAADFEVATARNLPPRKLVEFMLDVLVDAPLPVLKPTTFAPSPLARLARSAVAAPPLEGATSLVRILRACSNICRRDSVMLDESPDAAEPMASSYLNKSPCLDGAFVPRSAAPGGEAASTESEKLGPAVTGRANPGGRVASPRSTSCPCTRRCRVSSNGDKVGNQ